MFDKCIYCGYTHQGVVCPRIKSIEYWPDGFTVKRVELFAPGEILTEKNAVTPQEDEDQDDR